jgi:dienelactone hydrolase
MKKTILYLSIALLFGCGHSKTLIVKDQDIHYSYDNARVFTEDSIFPTNVNGVKFTKKMPVVVYAHGCAGINSHSLLWANYIKSLGYVVVMPDSMAIPNRIRNCGTGGSTNNMGLVDVDSLRPREIDYAIKELKKLSWVDPENIFLMGHSEGGMGVTKTFADGYAGIIISGYWCTFGIRADDDKPILIMEHEYDPWRANNNGLHCKDRWGSKRTNAQQLIFPGSGHDTFSGPGKKAVKEFLAKHKK